MSVADIVQSRSLAGEVEEDRLEVGLFDLDAST